MAELESNRQSTSVSGILSNSTNYIGLSRLERKLFDPSLFPATKTSEPHSKLISVLSQTRKKHTPHAWDLRVTGATIVLESFSQEATKCANLQIRAPPERKERYRLAALQTYSGSLGSSGVQKRRGNVDE